MKIRSSDSTRVAAGLLRFYSRWLGWYPSEFRIAYGAGMEQTFAERLHEVSVTRGRLKVAAFVIRETWGAAVGAIFQRATGLRGVMGYGGRESGSSGKQRTSMPQLRGNAVQALGQDMRHAIRSLRKNPGYTAVAVLTLTLGIGANTAIFSVVNGVLLTPLPYESPEELVRVFEIDPQGMGWGFSPPNFQSYRSEATLLEDMVAYGPTSLTLTGGGDAENLSAFQVSAGFFEFLGVPLAFGREFLPHEDGFVADPGAEQVVILDYGMWQRRFGGDRGVLGQTIVLDGITRTIVGIAPREMPFFSSRTSIWIPWSFDERDLTLRGRHWLRALGRLGGDVTLNAAIEELDAIAARLREAYPETNADWGVLAVPLKTEIVGDVRTPLWILMGAVGVVLLISCTNVANLSMARVTARDKEMAVRLALGAGKTRLLTLVVCESVFLALMGAAIGLVVAHVGLSVLLAGVGNQVPRASEVDIDSIVVAFTTLIAFAAGIFVALIAALQSMRRNELTSLKEGGQQTLSGAGGRRTRGALVVAEVALSLVLVIGAGLLLKSFWLLINVDTGFNHRGLMTATVSLPESSYETDAQREALFSNLLNTVGENPAVVAAAATTGLPFVGGYITIISAPNRPDEQIRPVARRRVTADYFRTMGIPLLAVRSFHSGDEPNAPHVAVINEALARRIYPDEQALGRQILWGGRQGLEHLEIVGIVGDVKQQGLAGEAMPAVYLEYAQFNVPELMYLTLRTDGDPLHLVPSVRDALRAVDPDLPLYDVTSMEQLISDSVMSERLSMLLLSVFAMVALVLGAVGIYGVMSYTVSQRTQEVGVRMALGAAHGRVVGMVVRQGMAIALAGIVLGTIGALALGRVLTGMLFQVSPTDPITYVTVTTLLTVVAFLACYAPARRAAMVDPVNALRYE